MKRELVFSAAGFGTGPVAGLGGGTALAPVLSRLDGIPGVRESRVDASGRFFLLALQEDGDEVSVLARAQGVLRGAVRRLDAPAAARQVAARVRGDPWFAANEVHALSYVEARILAVRTAASIAATARLAPAAQEALGELTRSILFRTVERIHAEGGRDSTGWFYEAWPAISRAVLDASHAFLDPDAHARVGEAITRLHAR
jgi:hypothetical protein